ncbi:hypothetical protein [Alteromonas sp. KUL106]|uniref:hypothetical protein n=1 Tax=Alteromonas sp. KUL106 TaxID=2480799 RepID=UPI00135BBD0F|nr:hypothetical protein [Alteromonas sp. KUL106]
MPNYLPFAILLCVFSITSVFAQSSVTPTYYKDCSILDFGEQDMSTMTEAEKIQALDDSLFGALNQSEECMNAAAQSSAQSVANAAGQGAGSGNSSPTASSGAGAGQANSQSSTESQDSSTNTQTTTSSSDPSKQSVGGQAKGGSSAVCGAVIAGLQGAKDEAEKAHFQALKEQYGC